MNLMIAKIVMRIVGTLVGLAGLFMLWFMRPGYKAFTDETFPWIGYIFILPVILVFFYLIYAAYLVWFKFSPLAVRHICGILALYALMGITQHYKEYFDPSKDRENPWPSFAFLGCFIIACFIYKIAYTSLNRFLFSETAQETPSGKS